MNPVLTIVFTVFDLSYKIVRNFKPQKYCKCEPELRLRPEICVCHPLRANNDKAKGIYLRRHFIQRLNGLRETPVDYPLTKPAEKFLRNDTREIDDQSILDRTQPFYR